MSCKKTILILSAATGFLGFGIRAPGVEPLTPVYPSYFGNRIDIPADNPLTVQGVQLGRMLFYETALSAGDRVSCATCHRQELAFTDGKRFSAGVDGTLQPRNTMSLANLLWVRNFFWDGRARGLEQQAETPLTNPHEMGQTLAVSARKLQSKTIYPPLFRAAFGSDTVTGLRIVQALAQFERTLISAGSRYDRYLQGAYQPTGSEAGGIALFYGKGTCGHCHDGPKTYGELFHNNGLDSIPRDPGRETVTGQPYDRGRFRVVTLRNIELTAPYMHDGRFSTLTDTSFITNPKFSNPFKN
ncbi:MAG: cytochrome-c peroxidase [Chitinophagaceae bacterium]|nr:cytochrome-c peroxidase [Chitinophagaceae bacterium]